MRTINYESDFKIIEGFKDGSSILAAPFKFTYYTKISRGAYVASYNGTEFVNCHPTDDGRVVVPFDRPSFGLGVLNVKREFFLNDKDYSDGVCNLVSVESTGIILDRGATDDLGEVEVLIEPFYHIINGGGASLIEVTDNPKEVPTDNTIAINTSNGKVFFGIANKGWWFVTAQMLGGAEVDVDTLKISAKYDNGTVSVSGEVKDGLLIL